MIFFNQPNPKLSLSKSPFAENDLFRYTNIILPTLFH